MLQSFADLITYNLLKISPESSLGISVNFFIYDVIKIYFLIFGVIFSIAFVRTFLDPTKTKNAITNTRFGIPNILASLFGAFTPFCSCSGIPIFMGFLEAKLPLSVAFSFLITSPLVNEVLLVMMWGAFGWKLALLYMLIGILLGVFGGIIIGKINPEKEILLDFTEIKGRDLAKIRMPNNIKGKIQFGFREALKNFKKLYLWVALGIAIGAFFHGYIPSEFLTDYLNLNSPFAVIIAVLVGIPIYAGCSTVAPVIFSAVIQGVPLGTGIAFLMAVAGLSLPEFIILKRVMSFKLLAIFFGIVALGIIGVGYIFNLAS